MKVAVKKQVKAMTLKMSKVEPLGAMSKRSMPISVELLSGDTLVLQVRPEMRIKELKQQIKGMRVWDDEVGDTTLVEVIVGGKKVHDDESLVDLGVTAESTISVLLRPNLAQCSDLDGPLPDLDPAAGSMIDIPDSETEIRERAFSGCKQLAKVVIPSSVTRIGNGAFSGCSSLRGMTIPDSVTHIASDAFSCCSSLATVTIPETVTEIGDCAFACCSSLRSVTIPKSATAISRSTFRDCSSLTIIDIPDSVKHIGESAFDGCRSLTSVTIPISVTSISDSAFAACSSLTTVTIPDSVTAIGRFAFRGCSCLTSVSIPDSVTTMGTWAFDDCNRLTLTMPARLLGVVVGCKAVAKECVRDRITSPTMENTASSAILQRPCEVDASSPANCGAQCQDEDPG